MRTFAMLAVGGLMAVAASSGASAQPAIDCGNPQNAITYYCQNRDEVAPMMVEPAPGPGVIVDVPTTGSVVVPDEVYPGLARGSWGSSAIDCGTPQNALTYYCNNRDQFSR